jgi:hypothetical protein
MGAPALEDWIRERTGAHRVGPARRVQTLWSGYGSLDRHTLEGGTHASVVVKVVRPPSGSGVGHRRKLRSYAVESTFYSTFARDLSGGVRVAAALGAREAAGGRWLLLEDLDAAGFPRRSHRLSVPDLGACIDWLAGFHATFLGRAPDGLWPRGTYWHLETRPDELARMPEGQLKDAAPALDAALAACPVQTLVHGDAKPANFCFGPRPGPPVAAVDFQYVGGGIGLVDLAYLVGCMGERWCARNADAALDGYFGRLHAWAPDGAAAAEAAWRPLWPVAWADFARFMAGWAGEDWRGTATTEPMVRAALAVV